MELLFRDDAVAVCRKPVGVLSEQSETEPSMVALLTEQCGKTPLPVHRLDKETAGLMVYAFTKEAAAGLSAQIQNGGFHKEYLAVCSGVWESPAGELRDLLYHDKQKNKSYPVAKERAGVKEARLRYTVLAESRGMSLLRVSLLTGRTHQIRVQFGSRKHPLYGDRKYGGSGGQLALFACSLTFTHPVTGERMAFEAKPEAGFPWSLFAGENGAGIKA